MKVKEWGWLLTHSQSFSQIAIIIHMKCECNFVLCLALAYQTPRTTSVARRKAKMSKGKRSDQLAKTIDQPRDQRVRGSINQQAIERRSWISSNVAMWDERMLFKFNDLVLGHPQFPTCGLQAQRQQGINKITSQSCHLWFSSQIFACEELMYLHQSRVKMALLQEDSERRQLLSWFSFTLVCISNLSCCCT